MMHSHHIIQTTIISSQVGKTVHINLLELEISGFLTATVFRTWLEESNSHKSSGKMAAKPENLFVSIEVALDTKYRTLIQETKDCKKDWRHCLHFLKNEAKISRIQVLPYCVDDIIWSQSLHCSDQLTDTILMSCPYSFLTQLRVWIGCQSQIHYPLFTATN